MAISDTMVADIQGDIILVNIRILFDWTDEPGTLAVPEGTIVQAYLPLVDEYIESPGEAWYVHPISGADWLSLPGDYEIVR